MDEPTTGIGRLAMLAEPYPTLEKLVERLKVHFGIPNLQVAVRWIIEFEAQVIL